MRISIFSLVTVCSAWAIHGRDADYGTACVPNAFWLAKNRCKSDLVCDPSEKLCRVGSGNACSETRLCARGLKCVSLECEIDEAFFPLMKKLADM